MVTYCDSDSVSTPHCFEKEKKISSVMYVDCMCNHSITLIAGKKRIWNIIICTEYIYNNSYNTAA